MSRLGPQVKKLFDYDAPGRERKKEAEKEKGKNKKYTFILPVDIMKKVKHSAVEQEKTISEWLTEAIKKHLFG
ncbi:MAG: hypothetical protein NC905_04120 [Candidatus Omnitrophica bacterium]|nr:hypothetical protein [Candidatus Omnitrophota bacterium]MCM8777430.1 hypothetical protein [Candidatus Omnitrophota bacterium]